MSINHQLSDSASPAELATHAKIVQAMLEELRRISSFAPSHLPSAIAPTKN